MSVRTLRLSLATALVSGGLLTFAVQAGAGTQSTATSARTPSAGRAATLTTPSWNPNVHCAATVTTLKTVLGTRRSPLGGATYAGGGFKPGIPDRRAFAPPCSVNGVPTFVEIRNIKVGSCSKINNDGDWTCTLTDPNLPASTPRDLTKIHIETGRNFRTAGGWSIPPGGRPINIQGFVFWDPGHTSAAWHNHSGWEIHSFTAWRAAAGFLSATPDTAELSDLAPDPEAAIEQNEEEEKAKAAAGE
ncbi:MAG: hypothetical protein M3O55_06615 [Actinomycetota bacterium]|nr:hypothetical protein [Actinomycetota bacterium]